ncbi:magnesium-dependent phosphatase 1-like [Argopecten irradians]|uniref:magnesium-dependent phosphatase 1-like n=1 Tax=Argopecten irradians TaxID=31199 RepID=UPI00371AA638
MEETPKPKMIIFDLDYTLWPFWVDRKVNVEPPFNRTPDGKVFDARSREIRSFPDIEHILKKLKNSNFKLAIASEAFNKEEVRRLVTYFGWDIYFDHMEVYPGSKITHLLTIKKESGVDFPDMMFFDDERDHLSEVAHTCLGVTCIWANRGVSEEILEEGFKAFSNNHISNANNNNNNMLHSSTSSLNSNDSEESQSDTTVFYVHKRRGSRASITYDTPPVIDRAVRLRGRRMSAPALSIPKLDTKKLLACQEINEN